ncbi:MAG: hypothetical protein ABL907_12435, partial [Hyphomicrobium sp.]
MTMDHNDIFSDTLANPAAKTPAHGGANLARDETSIVTEFEKAAATALTSVETYIRENPITAAVGIGAAGTLVALAIASRRSKTEPLDRRLRNELNRHSADVVRAMRRNANS